ncbi:MAG: type II secretion system GspH family protein [Betaproteobacteria bacterium]|nr:type II secretion system GspH family protein [Betaproteobacteria bacterium]
MKRRPVQYGFTLIEMAVALAIVALLAGGILLATRVQLTQRQNTETRQALEEAREALLAYAAVNGKLPCPAQGGAPGQGEEARDGGGACNVKRGLLPWETLGIRAIDGWGRRLAYLPDSGFTSKPALTTQGTIQIQDGTGTMLASTGAVAAAVWSWGANGYFATLPNGSTLDGSAAGRDETTNGMPTGTTIISRDESENTADPGGRFDDQVIWISRFILFGRMINAGQLP